MRSKSGKLRVSSRGWSLVPGGFMSSAILEAVLQHREHRADVARLERGHERVRGRYADDLVLLSRSRCSACLAAKIPNVYGNALTFDVDDKRHEFHDSVSVEYLDMVIHVSFDMLEFTTVHKNFTYAFSGKVADIKKHNMEPYLGYFNSSVVARHRGELIGRVRRWRTITEHPLCLVVLIAVDMVLCIRAGFALEHVRLLWRSLHVDLTFRNLVWASFDLVKYSCAHVRPTPASQLAEIQRAGDLAQSLACCSAGDMAALMGVVGRLVPAARTGQTAPKATVLAKALSTLLQSSVRTPRLHPAIAADFARRILEGLVA
ncbi:unnamed protein product [Prorocentrum cordatum]|uniref:RNA-directed DNA polymerase n=1 Tax=Prorocentrum cordatum TaxID=2364126 RepID=A0ABN9YEL7_9DINO|nr:unnamed protein product [Polarella glacialis]